MDALQCKNPDDMYFQVLTNRVRYFKENKRGKGEMCEIIRKLQEEAEENTKNSILTKMLNDGVATYPYISELLGKDIDEVVSKAQNLGVYKPELAKWFPENSKNPDDMYYPELSERVRYYKMTEKGRGEMSDIVQEFIDEERIRSIKSLMETMKWTVQQAMDALKIPSEEQAKYASQFH